MKKINYTQLKQEFLIAEKRDSENKLMKRKKYLSYGLVLIPLIIIIGLKLDYPWIILLGIISWPLIQEAITLKEYNKRHALLKKNIKMINIPLEYPHTPMEMIEGSANRQILAEYRFLKKAYDLKADMLVGVQLNENSSTSVRSTPNGVQSTTYYDYLYIGTAVQITPEDIMQKES